MELSGGGPGRTFTLGADDAAVQAARGYAAAAMDNLYQHTRVEVDDDHVLVSVGDPPTFRIVIPRAAIEKAERVPDHEPGTTLGVHGARDRWLVNAAYTRLVRLTLNRAIRADFRVQATVPAVVRTKPPWFLRPLLRDRSPKVRELTISVDDPQEFLAAIARD